MDNAKRSRNNSESPNKRSSENYPIKKLCQSPLKLADNSFSDFESIFGSENSFQLFSDYFDKENTNITNSPVKSEYNSDNQKLNISTWQRCRILNYETDNKNYDKIVKLRNDKTNEEGIFRLQGPWVHTKLQINEVVSILAKWCSIIKCYVINKDYGFVVTNPDFLISATSVVGSLFCRRKAVLQDIFRGIDSDNKIMVIGSIVHELFQIVLTKKVKLIKEIKKVAHELLQSQDIMFMLYSSKLSISEVEEEIQKFLPNIVNFVDRYLYGNKNRETDQKGIFQEKIETIQDIEENLWVPQFGLKGKVDVSVKIHGKNVFNSKPKLMPLELKTGRATFSMEHTGQVILYQMMLNEFGEKIESGLLLYLRDGIMKEIPSTRNEQRDLIMLRNDLAYYLNQNIKTVTESAEKNMNFNILLPEPINHHSACSKCPYNTICTSFMLSDKNINLPANHPLQQITKDCTEHLNSKDLEYFIFWFGILSLEEQEIKKSNKLSSTLWTESFEQRRKQGRAIINLKLNGNVDFNSGKYIHDFIADETVNLTQTDKQLDYTVAGISLGDYVIVSSLKRIAITAGHVFDIQKSTIKLSLERNLFNKYANDNFIIDKHDSQSGMIFNYTNLGILLENTNNSNRLRGIIINNIPPTFRKFVPNINLREQVLSILQELNVIQRSSVMKALGTEDYMLIKGLPGTGKTQTLVAIIRLYNLIGKSILITSHTHSAVDNLLIRLKEYKVKFLRLGAESRINPELTDYSEKSAISNCKDPDDLARIYSSFNIVGVTCLGTSHSIFTHRKFDICIVDEATQVYQPTVFRPLFFSDKFILVGDPDQLPPLVRSKEAKNLGADQSLFHRLDSAATSVLTKQYRMNKTITKLANDLTYGGKLVCGDEIISLQCLQLPKQAILIEKYKKEKWILRTLEKHIDQSVILLDTKNCFDQNIEFGRENQLDSSKIFEQNFTVEDENFIHDNRIFKFINYCDVSIVLSLVKALLIAGFSSEEIGIIAPYRAQVELLKKVVEDCCKFYADLKFDGLEVNTVDQFQGRDKKVILYSCTKTGNTETDTKSKESGILEDRRRLTVAITRSKHKLIIIGDEKCLVRYSPFRDLFCKIPMRCKVVLDDGKFGFSWRENLKQLKDVMN